MATKRRVRFILDLPPEHRTKLERLQQHLGLRSHSETIRALIDAAGQALDAERMRAEG